MAHGPRKKRLDFGGKPDHVTSGLRFGCGQTRDPTRPGRPGARAIATLGMVYPAFNFLTVKIYLGSAAFV